MPTSAAYLLKTEETTTAPPGAVAGFTEPSASLSGGEFLGFGLLRPFRRDLKSDFASASGESLLRSAVGQVLGTMAQSDVTHGELPWRTEFGSRLHLLRHRKNDAVLQELARAYVVEALKRWEPRISVTSVSATKEVLDGANVLALRIRYNLITSNVPGNNVLLSGIEQELRI